MGVQGLWNGTSTATALTTVLCNFDHHPHGCCSTSCHFEISRVYDAYGRKEDPEHIDFGSRV